MGSILQIKLHGNTLKDGVDKWHGASETPASHAPWLFWLNHLGWTQVGQKIIVGQNVLRDEEQLRCVMCAQVHQLGSFDIAGLCVSRQTWGSVMAVSCTCLSAVTKENPSS